MRFHQIAAILAIPALCGTAADGPETAGRASLRSSKPTDQLIHELSDDRFLIREEASSELWRLGEEALDGLRKAADGDDPEQAYRARELIRKIDLYITPTTDPAVIALVEQYHQASPPDKLDLLTKMEQKRAWRQMLKIYAAEKDAEVRNQYEKTIEDVALKAARESLVQGDSAQAREFLELAPATSSGLMALADFHRSQGTLPAELARAKSLVGPKGAAWRTALHRAAGDLEAARTSAMESGDGEMVAAMTLLQGNPVPWLRFHSAGDNSILQAYTNLAIGRWNRGTLERAADLEVLVKVAEKRKSRSRMSGINALFLLGQTAVAEPYYEKESPINAFTYYSALEKIDEALSVLGLDPQRPDYEGWVTARFKSLESKAGEDEEGEVSQPALNELLLLASFLESHGLAGEAASAFTKPLLDLAEKDAASFQLFLASLIRSMTFSGAPDLVVSVAASWAGEDDGRWAEITGIIAGSPDLAAIWNWMGTEEPELSRASRLEAYFALAGVTSDPQRLGTVWKDRLWAQYEKAADVEKPELLNRIGLIYSLAPDAAAGLKRMDLVRKRSGPGYFLAELSATGRWKEVADFYLQEARRQANNVEPEPASHAYAASTLRRAGRLKEAAEHDSWVDRLALGGSAMEIAKGYAVGGDFAKSAEWLKKAVREMSPDSLTGSDHGRLLEDVASVYLAEENWEVAAAIFEILAQSMCGESRSVDPLVAVKMRADADLARALAILPTDRPAAVRMLEEFRRIFPSDGSMADDFFPALRRVGLIEEHDRWFDESWRRMIALIERFPEGESNLNTAAWLASRANRQLDRAEELVHRALELNPDKAEYLDTVAEIHFARGDRAKALEWSTRAMNFDPLDPQLRQQYERFRSAALPP